METVNDKAVVFLPWNTIEPDAQRQILNTASMPFVFKHVAVMPDCHYGKGATVGTVPAFAAYLRDLNRAQQFALHNATR